MSTGWAIFGPPVRGRRCGGCTLCCTLLPVKSLGKPERTRCTHLRSKGCGIYARRPFDCRTFSCRWLMDETTAGLRRPDKAGYVIDPMTDTVLVDGQPCDVVQVWIDTPDAHRDPALRAWLEMVADQFGLPALIREDARKGFMLLAPSFTGGEWVEHRDTAVAPNDLVEKARGEAHDRWFGSATSTRTKGDET